MGPVCGASLLLAWESRLNQTQGFWSCAPPWAWLSEAGPQAIPAPHVSTPPASSCAGDQSSTCFFLVPGRPIR